MWENILAAITFDGYEYSIANNMGIPHLSTAIATLAVQTHINVREHYFEDVMQLILVLVLDVIPVCMSAYEI